MSALPPKAEHVQRNSFYFLWTNSEHALGRDTALGAQILQEAQR
jgi:hypothetical protein